MKWVAQVAEPATAVQTVVIDQRGSGVFLYLYENRHHATPAGEEWYESKTAAMDTCHRRYGIESNGWEPMA